MTEVIGAGFGRTGTLTLKTALDILGCGPCYHMVENVHRGQSEFWSKACDTLGDVNYDDVYNNGESQYKSSCDFPSCVFWEEQMRQYPDAKVILTVRDSEKWYKSATETIFTVGPDGPHSGFGNKIALALGLPAVGFGRMLTKVIHARTMHGDWSKDNIIKCYNDHNAYVMSHCPKEKLLVFEVSQGWGPLCEFLGKPIPDLPFPHVNDTASFQRMGTALNIFGYVITILGLGLPMLALPTPTKISDTSSVPPASPTAAPAAPHDTIDTPEDNNNEKVTEAKAAVETKEA